MGWDGPAGAARRAGPGAQPPRSGANCARKPGALRSPATPNREDQPQQGRPHTAAPPHRPPAVTLYRRKPSSCRPLTYRHRHIAPPCSAPRRAAPAGEAGEGRGGEGREAAGPGAGGGRLPGRAPRAGACRPLPGVRGAPRVPARRRYAGQGCPAGPGARRRWALPGRLPPQPPRPWDRALPRGPGRLLRPRCQPAISVFYKPFISSRYPVAGIVCSSLRGHSEPSPK